MDGQLVGLGGRVVLGINEGAAAIANDVTRSFIFSKGRLSEQAAVGDVRRCV